MTTENGKELGGHHCPDWDGLWVTPSSPEHEACTCYIGSAMTTNKPEVVAWIKETWRSATESRPVVHDWEDNGSVVSPLVRLSDYEALQAKCKEEIYRALQYRDAHFEALMQALEQVDALKSEREKLRKLATECADYMDTNDMTSNGHGSVLHRRLLDAAMAGGDQ